LELGRHPNAAKGMVPQHRKAPVPFGQILIVSD
jgi:hypothetical protein